MKHTLPVTLIVVCLFLASQYLGLVIVESYIDRAASQQTGNLTVHNLPSVAGMSMDRPEMEEETSVLFIFAAIIIGTVLMLLLIKYALNLLWKTWFFLATTLCLAFALYAFLRGVPNADIIVTILAASLAFWKVWKPNFLIHNITELFIYGGLAAIFFPHITVWSALALLALISVYDMYAVWKSKHMVKLANFQKDNDMFAGLSIPYTWPVKKAQSIHTAAHPKVPLKIKGEIKSAVLGGGDMGFPLLFTATVLTTKGFLVAAIIPPFAALGLLILLLLAKNDRFYPAMPFISMGCVLGWLVSLLF